MCRTVLLLVLTASPLFAADLDVTIKPVYLQTIAPRVLVDGRGTPWFCDKQHVHDTAGKRTASGPTENHRLILADKAGRFWFRHHWQGGSAPLVYTDGKQQTDTKLIMVAIHEDTAGRVFIRTPRSVHVLTPEGRWSEAKMFDVDNIGQTVFTEDEQGQTWMWVVRNQPNLQGGNEGTGGAWCFDRKRWRQHSPAEGFPFEHVEFVLPFADDWFVVIEHIDPVRNAPPPKAKVWSPTRSARQISETQRFAGLPTFSVEYYGTDLDGNRYLYRRYAAHDGTKQHEPIWVRVNQKGEVFRLDDKQKGKGLIGDDPVFSQPRVEKTPMRPILARPGDKKAVYPGTISYNSLGRDKEGRLFFHEHYGSGSHVLWPDKEKPGEILRMQEFGPHVVKRGFVRGADGIVWSVHENVEMWNGKQWLETPIKYFKSLEWTLRSGPPPNFHLANFQNLSATPLAPSGLLVTRVTTKYAGIPLERFGAKEKDKKVDPDAPFYKFETRLFIDNRWGDPTESMSLMKSKVKDLIRMLNVGEAERQAVAMCSDGKRLWVAFDWKLHAIESNGDTTTINLSKPKPKVAGAAGGDPETPGLMTSSMLPVGDGTILLVHDQQASIATFRNVKERSIALEEVKGATPATLYKDRDGTVWGWNRYQKLYQFKDKEFVLNKKAGAPQAITDDGVLWCLPASPDLSKKSQVRPVTYVRVCGTSIERFEWKNEEIVTGFTRVPKGSAVLCPFQHEVLCVDAQEKPGERPTLRKQTFAEKHGTSGIGPPFVVTGKGEILFCSHWGRLITAAEE